MAITRAQQARQMLQDGGMLVQLQDYEMVSRQGYVDLMMHAKAGFLIKEVEYMARGGGSEKLLLKEQDH